MRLTNQQVNAILNKIATEEEKKVDSDYKNEKENLIKEKKPIAEKYFKMYNSLPKELKKIISPYDRINEKVILTSLISIDKKQFDYNKYRNKIIIASIDSGNLQELMKKLNIDL